MGLGLKNPTASSTITITEARRGRWGEGYKSPEERVVGHGPPDRSCVLHKGAQPFCNDPRGGISEN